LKLKTCAKEEEHDSNKKQNISFFI
jgi:hypothetical protein